MTARYMIYLPADAPGRLIRCDDGDTCKLETLQQLVGGLIETADSCLEPGWAREPVDSIKLIVNEEGLLQELPINWKAMELYQYGYMSGIVGTAVLAAARGDELIGFAKPVCETICEELGLIWRMAYGTTDIPPVQRHQGGVLEHCQKGRAGAASGPVRGHGPYPGGGAATEPQGQPVPDL